MMWKAFRSRQLTGLPKHYHGYVGRVGGNKPELRCHDGYHRSEETATTCAKKTAKRLNRKLPAHN